MGWQRRARRFLAVSAIAVAGLGGGPATASGTDRGLALAERLCGGCHAVRPDAASGAHPDAPPFADLADRWPPGSLAEALAEGIVVGHGGGVRMPEFALPPDEIDALLGYLETLREG